MKMKMQKQNIYPYAVAWERQLKAVRMKAEHVRLCGQAHDAGRAGDMEKHAELWSKAWSLAETLKCDGFAHLL
jgi:hypothetical protein